MWTEHIHLKMKLMSVDTPVMKITQCEVKIVASIFKMDGVPLLQKQNANYFLYEYLV